MKITFSVLTILIILLKNGEARISNLSTLVAAECEFAAKSERSGIRSAFINFLSDNAIIFTPMPTKGKKWWMDRKETTDKLNWYPVYADISKSADFGYTTGPWEYKTQDKNGETVSAFGHYVSVWKKQQDGQWKVDIDIGISHPKPEPPLTGISAKDISEKSNPLKHKVNIEYERSSLIQSENEFSKASQTRGFLKAFKSFSYPNVRLYRMNQFPLVKSDQIYQHLSKTDGIMKWKPEDVKVSISGDLGYTYGIAQFWKNANSMKSKPDEKICFMRIWKKESYGKWKIVLDLQKPIPTTPGI